MICSRCNKDKTRLRGNKKTGNGSRGHYFIDENKRHWSGFVCPECDNERRKKLNRKEGHLPIDEVKTYHIALGRKSEKIVKNIVKELGYFALMGNVKGPDITILKNNIPLFIEVKTVSKRKKDEYHYIHCVQKTRKNDHLMAYVFENDCVYFCSMKEHLKNARPNGKLTVTEIWKKIKNFNRMDILNYSKETLNLSMENL
jgi:hypothetical protein